MARNMLIVAMAFFAVLTFGRGIAYGDDSLVLHYTFDKDMGGVAKDSSAHGNDGKIVKAQYMKEVNGRSGVIRFDGKSSFINCGNAQSLFFSGDMSLEMWVRPNDTAESSGTLLGCGRNFQFYGPKSLMVDYRYEDNHTRTELFKGKDILSNKWSHLALVVEYPRFRLYHNGVLVRDAYMAFPCITGDKAAKIIGQRCAIDLDEVRLYRRALAATEIAAHAGGKEVPPARAEELFVEPHWYEDHVALRLSCKGADYSGHIAEMTLLNGDHEQVVAPKKAALTESAEGSGRYVATVAFPLSKLRDKSLDGVARILGPAGKLVKTVYRHASLKKPDWVYTKEGYSDDVLPPWTPVKATAKADGAVEVDVWGRRHIFKGAIFPRQIETRGAEILASPITLSGRADGKAIAWTNGNVKIAKSSKTAASLEHISKSDTATLRTRMDIEYDGYMIFDCEVKALQDMTLDALTLEIPLYTRYATLCFGSNVYPEKKNPQIPMSTLHIGAVPGDLAFRFSWNVWLGNEELGLTWQAESNEDWRYADPQKAIEILPRGEITRFLANWINVPTKLAKGQTLHYKFALQATPVKPLLRDAWDLRILRSDPYTGSTGNPDLNLPDRWIKIDHAKVDRIYSVFVEELNLKEPGPGRMPALQFYKKTGARHLWINTHDNWPWPWPRDKQFARKLHRLINAAHANGLKIYSYLIHERMPTNVPEYDINGRHMSNLPLRPYMGVTGFCAKSKALQDAIVYNFARRLDEFGDDGVYLDGTGVHLKACRNTAHGCGYRPKQGAISPQNAVAFDQTDRGSDARKGPIYPTYPVFADRELIKRLYTVVKQRRPDGVMDVHSWYYNSAGLAYADMLWTGEQWWHLRGKGVKYVAGELTLDIFRTAFTGYQIGVAAETLPYRLLGNNTRNSQVAATSLLHDIPVRIRTQDTEWFDIMSRLWKVRERFGMKAAEKLFYWKNAAYVKVSPEKCYSTLFKHPKNGVLAFISNLSRDAQTVTVEFNLEKLGLRGKKLDVFDALTNEPVSMIADGKLSVPLGSEEWVYVWLRPAKTRF